MQKAIVMLILIIVLTSVSPNSVETITKEYDSISRLVMDIKLRRVFKKTKYLMTSKEFNGELIQVIQVDKYSPPIKVLVKDSYYGDTLFSEDLLRYIIGVSEHFRTDLVNTLTMVQYENRKQVNPCTQLNNVASHRAIFSRVNWFYRTRALGYKSEHIFIKYRELNKNYFEES